MAETIMSRRNFLRAGACALPVGKNHVRIIALALALLILLPGAGGQAVAQTGKAAYPAMAPHDQYLIADEQSEIALARSAAPSSISDGAEVMVLGREGYRPR